MAKAGELDWSNLYKSESQYEFSHSMSPKGVLTVTAKHHKDGVVGTASFSHDKTTDKILQTNRKLFNIHGLMPENIEVNSNHRRKGLATNMYNLASKVMGQPIVRPPKEHQTKDAIAFWESYGKLKKSWPDWSKEEDQLNKGSRVQLQATDEQLFGHLVRTEEQIKKAELEYEQKLNKWYQQANSNVDNRDVPWGEGKSFNSTLTEDERLKRNMYLKDDGDL